MKEKPFQINELRLKEKKNTVFFSHDAHLLNILRTHCIFANAMALWSLEKSKGDSSLGLLNAGLSH